MKDIEGNLICLEDVSVDAGNMDITYFYKGEIYKYDELKFEYVYDVIDNKPIMISVGYKGEYMSYAHNSIFKLYDSKIYFVMDPEPGNYSYTLTNNKYNKEYTNFPIPYFFNHFKTVIQKRKEIINTLI